MRKHLYYLLPLFLLSAAVLLTAVSCGGNPAASLEKHELPTAAPGRTAFFTVLCYNIQSRPVLDHASEKNPIIGRLLRKYDFAGIQEAFVSHDKMFEAADSLGGVYFGRRRHLFKLANSGLAVLSKYPVVKAEAEYFEDEGSLENRLGSKGILMVRHALNGADLDFYTTHLAAGTEADSGESRRNEMKQIINFIRRHSPPENAVILCGDFNLQQDALNPFLEFGLTNCAEELGFGALTGIDHILYRSGDKLKLTPVEWKILKTEFLFPDGKQLSDHSPVMTLFQVKAIP